MRGCPAQSSPNVYRDPPSTTPIRPTLNRTNLPKNKFIPPPRPSTGHTLDLRNRPIGTSKCAGHATVFHGITAYRRDATSISGEYLETWYGYQLGTVYARRNGVAIATTPGVVPDFGWRFAEQPVHLLNGVLLKLKTEPQANQVSILQCGICTVSCGLVTVDASFPRNTATVVQHRGKDCVFRKQQTRQFRVCCDCATHCPNLFDPAALLAELRQNAIVHASVPQTLSKPYITWVGLVSSVTVAMTAAALAVAVKNGGAS